ncbi:PREDICTED: ceramide synthase 1 [Thamnophis sirtalis]|uniref:Ceramide synthase 1 n=1 Tax=Thamnophis sirtalis TaxID=35019 RepID=A0A6I9XI55_9SAUR|nr:PREDICTED: ceramide synthase 1 [Thamnophis sirtalis]
MDIASLWSGVIVILCILDATGVLSSPSLLFLPGFPDWEKGMQVPLDIALAYLTQGSFYAHSIYATLYMDAWRKDSVVMLIHHVVTLTLIAFSYLFRYHNIGILVLFLHDFSDIQLEFTKLNVYFKYRGGIYHRLNDTLSNAGCVSFSVSWAVLDLRPQLSPRFLLLNKTVPKSFASFKADWFLLFFSRQYIVVFVAKVLLGQVQEVKDVREYDTDAVSKKTGKELHLHNSWKEGNHLKNGIVKDKRL